MKNTLRKIISAVSALLLILSMTGCTAGASSVSLKPSAEPEVVITEVSEELPAETEEKEEEETFQYISKLSEYSSSEEIEYTDYRENIVEEPVISIFGNTFRGKSVKSQTELYNEIINASLRGDSYIDIIIDGNFNPTPSTLKEYVIDGYGYNVKYEGNHYRYTLYYYPGTRVVKAYKNGTLSSLSASDKKLYEKARQIVNTYTSSSNSDYQNAKILYEYLVKNCYYDWGKYHRVTTANDALFGNGGTVCAGYADAYNLLLNLAGIKSCYVTGIGYTGTTSGGHAWNMAYIDGKWVYFDVTWDDPDCGNFIFYDYFAVSEATISRDHSATAGTIDILKKHA